MRQGYERIGRDFSTDNARRMCLDKRTYDSRNAARDHAKKKQKRDGVVMDAYRCSICGHWHLTSLSKVQSAIARKKNWRSGQAASRARVLEDKSWTP